MENTEEGTQDSERGGLVTARGTGDGLVIRLDGSVDPLELHESLSEFMTSRKSFLEGNEVALEWVGSMPDQAMVDSLSAFLSREFSITVRESRFRDLKRAGESEAKSGESASPILSVRSFREGRARKGDEDRALDRPNRFSRDRSMSSGAGSSNADYFSDEVPTFGQRDLSSRSGGLRTDGGGPKRVSLFDGIDVMNIPSDEGEGQSRYGSDVGRSDSARERSKSMLNPLLWDDPDARVVNMTLRSGQRIESDHSIIVRGDVNSGAEVIAGGDIIILGTLRGIAHAGAFDDTGGGRSIIALSLQPTQLRIGSLISRGKSDSSGADAGQGIEIARIEGNIIVVEPYQVRGGSRR